MKKFLSFMIAAAAICPAVSATEIADAEPIAEAAAEAAPQQSTWEKVVANMPKVSGYLQTGWNYTSNKNASTSSFQAKRLRLILDGKVGSKVDFRLQIEAFNGIAGSTNGNGQKNIQVMDAFATYKVCDAFKVRAGQFYTPLGYENYDISPATLETVDFSNIVYRIACRNPYEYNLVDYGRDLGVMLMGDLGDSGKGFKYFHYDVALTNGSIPCKDDRNNSKDLYISATIRPIKHLNIKGTFNWGEYSSQALAGGTGAVAPTGANKYNPMNRCVVGAWYNNPTGLDVRAEYGFMKSKVDGNQVVDEQGAYALVGYHAGKFLPIVRWDMYKDKMHETTTNNYNRILVGLTYQPIANVKVQLNYGHFMYNNTVKNAGGLEKSEQIQLMGLFKF